jgi:hypothetical protein
MNDRVEEQQEQQHIQPGKEKENNECERPCKRMRSEEQLLPAVVHCYRAFNVHNFNCVDFKFFSNGMLSADNGVMHGQWRLERQNIRITWQKNWCGGMRASILVCQDCGEPVGLQG